MTKIHRFSRGLFTIALAALALFAGCESPADDTDDPANGYPDVVSLADIREVTPPEFGETPVSAVYETDEYTGTVEWEPAVTGTFAANTVYTATITLEVKAGYTVAGVERNFFKVAGAVTVTNAASSNVVKAAFQATEAIPPAAISIKDIPGITPPVDGEPPVTAIETEEYTGEVVWSHASGGSFQGSTIYTAFIWLTPKPGYTFAGVPAGFFNVAGATKVTDAEGHYLVIAVFPKTEATPGYTGTPDTSWYDDYPDKDTYTIYNADQLAGLAVLASFAMTNPPVRFLGKTIILGDDIDLTIYGEDYRDGKGWLPIGAGGSGNSSYDGIFDGNYKTISNLYINDPTTEWRMVIGPGQSATIAARVGLFASGALTSGTSFSVKNLGLVDVRVTGGGPYVGGLVGLVGGTTVTNRVVLSNCYVTGTVTGANSTSAVGTGGLVGGSYLTIENCYFAGTVNGVINVGGLAGRNMYTGSFIRNSFTAAEVRGTGNVGGLVGNAYANSKVADSAALGPRIVRASGAAATFGRVEGSATGTVTNVAAFAGMEVLGETVTSGDANSRDGTDITAAELINGDGTIGNRFLHANGWTVENGKLPGFGAAVPAPEWIN